MHVQSCCFADMNLLLFCRSHCLRCRHCLSSLIIRLWGLKTETVPVVIVALGRQQGEHVIQKGMEKYIERIFVQEHQYWSILP